MEEPDGLYRPYVIDELVDAGMRRGACEDMTDPELEEEYLSVIGHLCTIIDDADTD